MKFRPRNYIVDASIDVITLIFLLIALFINNWVIFEDQKSIFKLGLFSLFYILDTSFSSAYSSVPINEACQDKILSEGSIEQQTWYFTGTICPDIMLIRIMLYTAISCVGISVLVNTYMYFSSKKENFLLINYIIIFLGLIEFSLMIVTTVKSVSIEHYMCSGDFNGQPYENCNLGFSFVCPVIVLVVSFGTSISRILTIRYFLKKVRGKGGEMGQSLTNTDSLVTYSLTSI